MKKWLLFSALSLSLMSCDRPEDSNTSHSSDQNTRNNVDNGSEVDNTGRNVRDREFNTLTSGDQSESEMDRTITQNIRKALMADGNLSINAKNVKVITINGLVTLRGPIDNPQERDQIEKISRAVNGVKRVDNQLEVKMAN